MKAVVTATTVTGPSLESLLIDLVSLRQLDLKMLAAILIALFVVQCQGHSHDELSEQYTHHVQLDNEGKYSMFYSVDTEKSVLKISVCVQTTGWIGLGFSPNGQMPGSDVVIGWVDSSGKSFLQVHYIHSYSYIFAIGPSGHCLVLAYYAFGIVSIISLLCSNSKLCYIKASNVT